MPSRKKPNDTKILTRARQASKLGLKYELTAKYCGISESTLYKWIALGRVDQDGNVESEDHRAFSAAVSDGEAEGAVALLARIIKASDRSWQAAAWILERRHDYTRTERRELEIDERADPRELVLSAVKILQDD